MARVYSCLIHFGSVSFLDMKQKGNIMSNPKSQKNYIAERDVFLNGCGDPKGADRDRAIADFESTLFCQVARLNDAFDDFSAAIASLPNEIKRSLRLKLDRKDHERQA